MNAQTHNFPADPAELQRQERRRERVILDLAENDLEVDLRESMRSDNADLVVTDLRNLADDVAEQVALWIERLRKIDERVLAGGGQLTTADTHDWAQRIAEVMVEPMAPLAARVFGQAVKVRGL